MTVDNGYDPKAALAVLQHAELLQIQYGAIIISFLGAIHWGFEVRLWSTGLGIFRDSPLRSLTLERLLYDSQWAKFGGVQGNPRYLIGVVPVMAGWGSLLISGQLALVAQWATFFAQWYVDQRTTSKGWAPKWYATVSSVGGLFRKSFRHTDSGEKIALLPTRSTASG